MKNIFINSIILISGLSLLGNCLAGVNIKCPGAVHLSSGTVNPVDVPTDFRPVISKSIERLSGYSVFDGPPEEEALLKPWSSSAKSNRSKWLFDQSVKYEVWVSCDYADGLIRLVQRVSNPVSACTAISQKIGDPKNLEVRFVCE